MKKAEIEKSFENIIMYTDERFVGTYKKHRFSISTLEKRGIGRVFDIEVTDERGCYAVNTWEEIDTIEDAINYGIKGAVI